MKYKQFLVSEEELLRIERKRKQMEKQAEYKRLMKEREQQKANENKKISPKYWPMKLKNLYMYMLYSN